MITLELKDTNGKPTNETWEDLQKSIGRIKAMIKSLGGRFFAREELFKKIMYALVMGEHVLMFGRSGTAKTALANAVIGSITDARIWSSNLSRGMGEAQIFGDFDIQHAQISGALRHLTKGSLLEADFANIGEFLDANVPLLRTLLGVLHEREFKRGEQYIRVPLLTAIASTNTSPVGLVKVDKEDVLGAVVDRFLFWQGIEALKLRDERLSLLRVKAGIKKAPAITKISLGDVQLAVRAIKQMDFILEDAIVIACEEITGEFMAARNRPISDRRLSACIDTLEASALLRDSHDGVGWDDLSSLSLILVDDSNDHAKFAEICARVIAKGHDTSAQDRAESETALVDTIMRSVSEAVLDPQPGNLDLVPEGDLVRMKREAITALKALRGLNMLETQSGKEYRRQKAELLSGRRDYLGALIDQGIDGSTKEDGG